MKLLTYTFMIQLVLLAASCQKHVVEYQTTSVDGLAEYQLYYYVPVEAVTGNNMYKVEVNDKQYVNGTTTSDGKFNPSSVLSTYSIIPNALGRYYTESAGQVNIKLYAGASYNMVYNQSTTLKSGKQFVFIYDHNKAPIVFDAGYPYVGNTTEYTDSTAWVQFFNFLYEDATMPSNLKLQYQYQYTTDYTTNTKSDWINIGNPVSFGEATGWQAVRVRKSVQLSSGTANLSYRIRVIGSDNTDQGDLQIINSSNKIVPFVGFSDASIGRRYNHILSGVRTMIPRSAVRVVTVL